MKTTDVAHTYWKEILIPGGIAIDATVGNGHDTKVLAELLQGKGEVYGYDIQKEALDQAKKLLAPYPHVTLLHKSHTTFSQKEARLIVYNLGYLPGGNKMLTTLRTTTLESLSHALPLVISGGALSIMCYPGHQEGEEEEEGVIAFAKGLPTHTWSVCHHQWINRHKAPSLLLIRRH